MCHELLDQAHELSSNGLWAGPPAVRRSPVIDWRAFRALVSIASRFFRRSLQQDSKRLNQKGDSPIQGFVIQDAGWGGGQHQDGKTLFARPAGSRGQFGGERAHLSGDGGAVWGERGSIVKWSQRWRATGSAAAKQMGGWRQLRLQSEREWLLARIAEKPDLTLRAVVAELAERGTPASYGAVWRFFTHAGITLKKNSARQRAGSRRRRSPPDPEEGVSGPA